MPQLQAGTSVDVQYQNVNTIAADPEFWSRDMSDGDRFSIIGDVAPVFKELPDEDQGAIYKKLHSQYAPTLMNTTIKPAFGAFQKAAPQALDTFVGNAAAPVYPALRALKGATMGYVDLAKPLEPYVQEHYNQQRAMDAQMGIPTRAPSDPFGGGGVAEFAGATLPFILGSGPLQEIAKRVTFLNPLGRASAIGAAELGAYEGLKRREDAPVFSEDQLDPLGRVKSAAGGAALGAAFPMALAGGSKLLQGGLRFFDKGAGAPIGMGALNKATRTKDDIMRELMGAYARALEEARINKDNLAGSAIVRMNWGRTLQTLERLQGEVDAGLRGITQRQQLKLSVQLKRFQRGLSSGKVRPGDIKRAEKVIQEVSAPPVKYEAPPPEQTQPAKPVKNEPTTQKPKEPKPLSKSAVYRAELAKTEDALDVLLRHESFHEQPATDVLRALDIPYKKLKKGHVLNYGVWFPGKGTVVFQFDATIGGLADRVGARGLAGRINASPGGRGFLREELQRVSSEGGSGFEGPISDLGATWESELSDQFTAMQKQEEAYFAEVEQAVDDILGALDNVTTKEDLDLLIEEAYHNKFEGAPSSYWEELAAKIGEAEKRVLTGKATVQSEARGVGGAQSEGVEPPEASPAPREGESSQAGQVEPVEKPAPVQLQGSVQEMIDQGFAGSNVKSVEEYRTIRGKIEDLGGKPERKGAKKSITENKLKVELAKYQDLIESGALELTDKQKNTYLQRIEKVLSGKATATQLDAARLDLIELDWYKAKQTLKGQVKDINPNLEEVLRTEFSPETGVGKQLERHQSDKTMQEISHRLTGVAKKWAGVIDKAMKNGEKILIDYVAEASGHTSTFRGKEVTPFAWGETAKGKPYFKAYNSEGHQAFYYLDDAESGSKLLGEPKLLKATGYRGVFPNVYKGPGEYQIADVLSRAPREAPIKDSEVVRLLESFDEVVGSILNSNAPKPLKDAFKKVMESDKVSVGDLKKIEMFLRSPKNREALQEVCKRMGI